MPDDYNLELLATVHNLQSNSQKAQQMLAKAVEISGPAGFFPMTLETAAMVQALLRVQSKLIATLMEQNQEIVDRVQDLVARLEED